MHTETVEIYSDKTNAVVLRHSGRKFPGVLVQGDSLHALCCQADEACAGASSLLGTEAYDDLMIFVTGCGPTSLTTKPY